MFSMMELNVHIICKKLWRHADCIRFKTNLKNLVRYLNMTQRIPKGKNSTLPARRKSSVLVL